MRRIHYPAGKLDKRPLGPPSGGRSFDSHRHWAERFMHKQDGHQADFLDRQSLGAVVLSTMLTIALIAAIYIGFVAR